MHTIHTRWIALAYKNMQILTENKGNSHTDTARLIHEQNKHFIRMPRLRFLCRRHISSYCRIWVIAKRYCTLCCMNICTHSVRPHHICGRVSFILLFCMLRCVFVFSKAYVPISAVCMNTLYMVQQHSSRPVRQPGNLPTETSATGVIRRHTTLRLIKSIHVRIFKK